MALQDLRPAALGQALRPNIWDAVALIFVIGAIIVVVGAVAAAVLVRSKDFHAPTAPARTPAPAPATPVEVENG